MNFDFSDEQKMMAEQVKRLLSDHDSVQQSRKVLENADVRYDQDLWQKMVEMGLLGITIPEQYGGLGLGYLETCVIAEELGKGLAAVPYSSTVYLFTEALLQFGTSEQKSEVFPQIVEGAIGTVAISEEGKESRADNIGTRFTAGTVTGTKTAVLDGDIAKYAVVLAADNDDTGLYLVELDHESVTREAVASLDDSRSYTVVTFDDTPAQPLADMAASQGYQAWDIIRTRAATLYAFEQVGGSDAALEMAKTYALGRYAFGRSIATYQAVKHRLADMYIKMTLARSNSYYAAWAISTGAAELPLAASTARVSATQAFQFNAQENIQLHGGNGFTWEYDCHLYYRRSKGLSVVIGSEQEFKDKMVEELRKSNTN